MGIRPRGPSTPAIRLSLRSRRRSPGSCRAKQSNLHFIVGKASFDEKKLAENYGAALDEVLRAKPSSSKGRYLKKITVSTTAGPGIPVDTSVTRNFTEESS